MPNRPGYPHWCVDLDDRGAMAGEALRLHDPETLGHCLRVAAVSEVLGRAAGLSAGPLDTLCKAGALHDIGKLALDPEMLHAPRALTAEEYKRIQVHAQAGSDLLDIADPEQYHEMAHLVLEHHERWDGNGYPHRLKAQRIHFLARLLSIADVFDALASPRAYKPGWPEERIRSHFIENRGLQFDPGLTGLFLDCYASCAAARDGVPGIASPA